MLKHLTVPKGDDLKLPSFAEVQNLSRLLTSQGIPFPENIIAVASGVYGLFFIGKKTVFKLFRSSKNSQYDDYWKNHFKNAVRGYELINQQASAFAAKDIDIPTMFAHGFLAEKIKLNDVPFHAWYVISAINGCPLPPLHESRHDTRIGFGYSKLAGFDIILSLSTLLTIVHTSKQYHVQVTSAGKEVKTASSTEWLDFSWVDRVKLNPPMSLLIKKLMRDVDVLEPRICETTTLLHGDPKPRNILKKDNGKYCLIDWDQHKLGTPELEFWYECAARPDRIHYLCTAYNSTAAHPMSETRLTTYALAGYMGIYFIELAKANVVHHAGRFHRIGLPHVRRLSQLAQHLHHLTGKTHYTELANIFQTYVRKGKTARPLCNYRNSQIHLRR